MSRNPYLRAYILVILLTLAWGVSWPIVKIGLEFMQPAWFAAYRLIIGLICIFLLVTATRNLVIPDKRDLPMIFVMGIIQMGLFLVLITMGLYFVDPGRSAMLVYTTPLWVTPLAVIFFKEKLTIYKTMGLVLGIIGILLLFSPWEFDWTNKDAMLGNALLLLSALCWAIAILCARQMTWYRDPLQLVLWQMLVGLVPVLVLAYLLEPNAVTEWNVTLISTLLFTGIFATAFGFWGTLVVSKELPSITVSLCYLAIPVAGIISSAIIVHEVITPIMMIAMVLILSGVACVAWGRWRENSNS